MNADTIATPVGTTPARLLKRPGDDRPFVIDLAPVLRLHDLATGVDLAEAPGLTIGKARTREGRFAEVVIGGGQASEARPFTDYSLRLIVRTLSGAVEVAVDVRVIAR